jgi:hypothetical protein
MEESNVELGSIVAVPKSICRTNGLCFFANYNVLNNYDATWARGAKLGMPYYACENTGGYYNPVDSTSYIDYYGRGGNADTAISYGCVRVKVLINSPFPHGTDCKLFGLLYGANHYANSIELGIDGSLSNATIRLIIHGMDGTELFNDVLGEWPSPTYAPPTWYEFELNWDLDNGIERLFIDGTQFGSTLNVYGSRSSEVNIIRVGNGFDLANNFAGVGINDFMIFDSVQHTEDYDINEQTPDLILPESMDSSYVLCDGNEVINENSIYNGMLTPDMSLINENIVWAWKIL